MRLNLLQRQIRPPDPTQKCLGHRHLPFRLTQLTVIGFKHPRNPLFKTLGPFSKWQLPPNLLILRHRRPGQIRPRHRSSLEVVAIWKGNKCTAICIRKAIT